MNKISIKETKHRQSVIISRSSQLFDQTSGLCWRQGHQKIELMTINTSKIRQLNCNFINDITKGFK